MSELSRVEARALQALDAASTVELLTELLRVPSVSGTDAECDIQHLLAQRLERLGLEVDLWPLDLPELELDPGFPGVETTRSEAWGLVGDLVGDSRERALVLQGHVDVVPAGDRSTWSGDPFRPVVTADRVRARGACDMKAGLAANLAAVTAIADAGIDLLETLSVQFVVGEEDGGLGAFGTLARGHRGRACIITEPTSNTLITANAGALTFTIQVPGLATHASTSYAGSSAIDSYLAIHLGLGRLERERNRTVEPLMQEYPVAYPICVGRLRAGEWSSSVPDLLVADGRMGTRIGEDPLAARAELEQCVAGISAGDRYLRDHPPVITWAGGQFAGGSLQPGHELRHLVGTAHADVTGEPRLRERGAPYGSDLRLYAAAGIPTLHYGPGQVRLAHGPDESVVISEVLDVARTLVLAVLRACGARESRG